MPPRRNYVYPPGLQANLLWYAFRKFRPADPIVLFEYLAKKFGSVVHYKLGPEHIVFVNEPELIREILVVQNSNFIKERTVQRTKMLLGEGMITAEGQQHRGQRQASQPAFHRQRIGSYADTIVERAAATRERWEADREVDVAPEMMELTLDIVGRTLFSSELGPEVREVAQTINHIMRLYNYLVLLPGVEILVNIGVPGLAGFAKDKQRLDAIVFRMIDQHLHSPQRDDLLDMMLNAAAPNGETLTSAQRDNIRDQVLTIFLAGYETVANALTWTWYLLSQNPDAATKMQQEIATVLNGRLPQMADLPQLTYTEMVLKESLRIFPPAWAMGRKALHDFALGPYFLPAGSTMLMSQYITHRDDRFFPEPMRFWPERFDPASRMKPPRFAYFPFGAGFRQCIGESFAWMEGVLILATIAQKWSLLLKPGQRVEPQPLITLRPKYGMKMIARRPSMSESTGVTRAEVLDHSR